MMQNVVRSVSSNRLAVYLNRLYLVNWEYHCLWICGWYRFYSPLSSNLPNCHFLLGRGWGHLKDMSSLHSCHVQHLHRTSDCHLLILVHEYVTHAAGRLGHFIHVRRVRVVHETPENHHFPTFRIVTRKRQSLPDDVCETNYMFYSYWNDVLKNHLQCSIQRKILKK